MQGSILRRHYSENLTLEVLAGEIHMNPYCFQAAFKKNSGENFKDYLNKVRMNTCDQPAGIH